MIMTLLDLPLDVSEWERQCQSSKRDCVIDAGANIGGFTETFLAGGAKIVHAFEPVPWVFSELQKRYGEDSRVILNCLGISDHEYTIANLRVFNCWSIMPSGSRRDEVPESIQHPAFSATFTTLDIYCAKHTLKPDLLKIDVDGCEVKALIGARAVIDAYKPLIYIELSTMIEWFGNTPVQFAEEAIRMNYEVVSVCGKMRLKTKQEILDAFPPMSSLDVMMIPL